MVMLPGSVADCRGEWPVRLPYAPRAPHGKPAPLLAEEARSTLTLQ